MYCVRCGVKLQDGAPECPLCHTPAWLPDTVPEKTNLYSDRYPDTSYHARYSASAIITAAIAALSLSALIFCLKTYGSVSWSGYVIFSLLLLWVIAVLPLYFRKYRPLVFIPVDFGAILLFLLFICLFTHGHWFLSFALPVTLLVAAITITAIVLYRYIKKHRLYITGGLLIAIGLSFMLIEFFIHITWGKPMFVWSLYCVSTFCLLGMFLIVAAIIKPLREYLERKFFI